MDSTTTVQVLGNLGEFIGSLAILVTLGYLSAQVRQARRQQEVSDRQTREFALRDYHMDLATSDALAPSLINARNAIGAEPRGFVGKLVEMGVTEADAVRVFSFYVAGFRIWANTYYTSNDEQQQAANDWSIRSTYGNGLGAIFWEHYAAAGMPALGPFGSHVKTLLEGTD